MARSQLKEAPKPLMIRGDRLLLALEVLVFFKACGGYMGAMRSVYERMERNPRGFTHAKVCAILEREAYSGIMRALKWIAWETAHALLRTADACALRNVTFNALGMVVWAGNRWLPRKLEDDEATRYLMTGDLAPLLQFLRAIASGELTEEDFREVAR